MGFDGSEGNAGELLSEEQILAIRDEHGGKGCITVWESPNEKHQVIVRRMKGVEYERFEQAVARAGKNPEKHLKTQRQVVLDCLVHPSREDFGRLLQDYPALNVTLSEAIMRMSGAAADDDLKKY